MTFSADLIVRCSLFLSCSVASPNQTMTDVHRTDWMVEVWKAAEVTIPDEADGSEHRAEQEKCLEC